jgi:RNase adaptor protein for sRNA GlmZ degradation
MIIIGGQNGTGKTSLCLALEKYGLKCNRVPELCYEPKYTLVGFEIYSLAKIVESLRGEVVDESPLTVALYLRAIPLFVSDLEYPTELVKEAVNGIEEYVKEKKEEGVVSIWLTAQSGAIMDRLLKKGSCTKRDFVRNLMGIGNLKAEELKMLERWKDIGLIDLVLDTTEKSPEELAEEVFRYVNKNRS